MSRRIKNAAFVVFALAAIIFLSACSSSHLAAPVTVRIESNTTHSSGTEFGAVCGITPLGKGKIKITTATRSYIGTNAQASQLGGFNKGNAIMFKVTTVTTTGAPTTQTFTVSKIGPLPKGKKAAACKN